MDGGRLRSRPFPDVPAWCPATICKLSKYPSNEHPRSLTPRSPNSVGLSLSCQSRLSRVLFVNIMFTHVLPITMLLRLFALNYPQLFSFLSCQAQKPAMKYLSLQSPSLCNLAFWLLSPILMSCAVLFGLNAFLYFVPSPRENPQRPNDTYTHTQKKKKKKDSSPLAASSCLP